MSTLRTLLSEREPRLGVVAWAAVPALFLFFALTLAVDPSANLDRIRFGAVVLDRGATTPQGQVAIGEQIGAGLRERLGVTFTRYADEATLGAAVLARDVDLGLVLPEDTTARLVAGQSVDLRVVRSDANDPFLNAFAANVANTISATLNAALPALLGRDAGPATPVTVSSVNVAPTSDFRFALFPATLVLPLWMSSIAFTSLVARSADRIRTRSGLIPTAVAELSSVVVGAAVAAVAIALSIALFTWRSDLDVLTLAGFLWLGLVAIGWSIAGLLRVAGIALGAAIAVLALFVQQPVSGASFPAAMAPDAVRWAESIAPLRAIVEGLRNILIGGSTTGDLALGLAAIAGGGLVLYALGLLRLGFIERRRLAGAPA